MSTTLGDLLLGTGLETERYYSQLEGMRADAIRIGGEIERTLSTIGRNTIKVAVDDTALTRLNQHYDLKLRHHRQVVSVLGREKIKPEADLSAFKEIEAGYKALSRAQEQARVSSSRSSFYGSVVDVGGRSASGSSSGAGSNSASILTELKLIRQDIKSAARQVSQKPKSPSATGSIKTGFFEGIGQDLGTQISREFQKSAKKQLGKDVVGSAGKAFDAILNPDRYDGFEDKLVDKLEELFVYTPRAERAAKVSEYAKEFAEPLREQAAQAAGSAVRVGTYPAKIRKRVNLARSAELAKQMAEGISVPDLGDVQGIDNIALVSGGIDFKAGGENAFFARNILKGVLGSSTASIPVPSIYSNEKQLGSVYGARKGFIDGMSAMTGNEGLKGMGDVMPVDKLLQVAIEAGFNPDAVIMEATRIALEKKYPNKNFIFGGTSGGSAVAEEAVAIAERGGASNVKGFGATLGLAGLTNTASPENYQSFVGSIDPLFLQNFGTGYTNEEELTRSQRRIYEGSLAASPLPKDLLRGIFTPGDNTTVIPNIGAAHHLGQFVSEQATQEKLLSFLGMPEADSSFTGKSGTKGAKVYADMFSQYESLDRTFKVLGGQTEALAEVEKGKHSFVLPNGQLRKTYGESQEKSDLEYALEEFKVAKQVKGQAAEDGAAFSQLMADVVGALKDVESVDPERIKQLSETFRSLFGQAPSVPSEYRNQLAGLARNDSGFDPASLDGRTIPTLSELKRQRAAERVKIRMPLDLQPMPHSKDKGGKSAADDDSDMVLIPRGGIEQAPRKKGMAGVAQRAGESAESMLISRFNELLAQIPGDRDVIENNPRQISSLKDLNVQDYVHLSRIGGEDIAGLFSQAFGVAQGVEGAALDMLPFGRQMKGVGKNVALPAAAFTAAGALPGGHMAQHAISTALEGVVGLPAGALAEAISGTVSSALLEAVGTIPMLGPKIGPALAEAIAGVVQGGITGSAELIAGAAAPVVGGQAMLGAGKQAINAIAPGGDDRAARINQIAEGTKREIKMLQMAADRAKQLLPVKPSAARLAASSGQKALPSMRAQIDEAIGLLPEAARMSTREGAQLANLKSQIAKQESKLDQLVEGLRDLAMNPFGEMNRAVQGGDFIEGEIVSEALSAADPQRLLGAGVERRTISIKAVQKQIKELGREFTAKAKTIGYMGEQDPDDNEAAQAARDLLESVEYARDAIDVMMKNPTVKNSKDLRKAAGVARGQMTRASKKASVYAREGEDIGENVALGLSTGLAKKIGEVEDTARGMAKGVIEVTKDEFEIKSPSRVMERIAKDVVKGFDIGLQGLMNSGSFVDDVVAHLSDKFPGLADTIQLVGDSLKGLTLGLVGLKAFQVVSGMLTEFTTGAIEVAIEFEKIGVKLKFIEESAISAKNSMAGLLSDAADLGTNAREDIFGYTQIQAASKDTSLEGFGANQLFEAGRQASLVYQLSGEEQSRVFTAFEQMISKGNISAEELRCFDEETEVFTNSGWIKWKDQRKETKFAVLNESREIHYAKSIDQYSYEYEGKMLRIDSENVKAVITPNHRVLTVEGDKVSYIRADELENRDYTFLLENGSEAVVRKDEWSWIDYKGLVYCATTPTGNLLVRRHGGAHWSGNSQLSEHLPGAFQTAARSMGVTTAELNKMLERGEVLSSEFLPKFAQQLSAETASGVVGASNTTQASINRLSTSMLELQSIAGGALLPIKKSVLKGTADGVDFLTNNLRGLLSIAMTLAGSAAWPFIQKGLTSASVLLRGLPGLLRGATTGLVAMQQTLARATAVTGAFAVKMLAIEVAISAARIAWQVFNTTGGEGTQIAEGAVKSYDNLIERLEGVETAAKGASEGLQAEGYIGKVAEMGDSLDAFTKKHLGFFANLGAKYQESAFDLVFTNPQIERQQAKRTEDGETLRSTTAKTLELSQSYLTGENRDVLQSRVDVDRQIQELQQRQQVVRALRPGSTEELAALVEDEQRLLEARGKSVETIESIRSAVDSRISEGESRLKALEDDFNNDAIDLDVYESEVKTTKNSIAEAKKEQESWNNALNQTAASLNSLTRSLQGVMAQLSDANLANDFQTALYQGDVAQARVAGATSGEVASANRAIEQNSLAQQLANNQAAVERTRALLQTSEVSGALRDAGVNDYRQFGPADLTNKIEYLGDSSPRVTFALETVKQLQELEQNANELGSQLSQGAAEVSNELTDMAKSIEEFFRGIQQEAEQLEIATKGTENEANLSRMKGEIQEAMVGFSKSFINDFGGSLISLIEAFNEPLQNALAAQEGILSAQMGYLNSQLQANQLKNQLPGLGGFNFSQMAQSGGGIAGGFASPIQGQALSDVIGYQQSAGQDFDAYRAYRSSYHGGVDFDSRIGGGEGGIVQAVTAGVVSEVRAIADNKEGAGGSVQVRIESLDTLGNAVEQRYTHLSRASVERAGIVEGARIGAGQSIGSVGDTDTVSSGAHLDYKITVNGQFVDPDEFLQLGGQAGQLSTLALGNGARGSTNIGALVSPVAASNIPPTATASNVGVNVPSGLTAEGQRMASYMSNPNVMAALDMLAMAEMGPELLADRGGFNTGFGGRNIPSLRSHPFHGNELTPDGVSSASGRYQFMGHTWAEEAERLGLSDFSPGAQTVGAISRLDYRGVLDDVANGNMSAAWGPLGYEWASLEGNPYGQGTPLGRKDQAMAYFEQRRQAYASGSAGGPAGGPIAGGMAMGAAGSPGNSALAAQYDAFRNEQTNVIGEASALSSQNLNQTIANIESQLAAQNALSEVNQRMQEQAAQDQLTESGRNIAEQDRLGNRRVIDLQFEAMEQTPGTELAREVEELRRRYEDDTLGLDQFVDSLGSTMDQATQFIDAIGAVRVSKGGILPDESADALIESLQTVTAQAEPAYSNAISQLGQISSLYQDLNQKTLDEAERARIERDLTVSREQTSLSNEVRRADITRQNGRGAGREAIQSQFEIDLSEMEMDLDARIRELEDLGRRNLRTPEEVATGTAMYEALADSRFSNLEQGRDSSLRNLGRSEQGALADRRGQLGQTVLDRYRMYGGTPFRREGDPNYEEEFALEAQQRSYESEVDSFRQEALDNGYSPEVLQETLSLLEQINEVKLDNIRSEFNEFKPALDLLQGSTTTLFEDLLTGTKSIGESFRDFVGSVISGIAKIAAQKASEALFGGLLGGTGGGGLGGLLGSIFGAKDGGEVPNYMAGGDVMPISSGNNSYREGYGEISKALAREGPNGVLAALTPGEMVLTVAQTRKYKQLGLDKVLNYKDGGIAGVAGPDIGSTMSIPTGGQGMSVNINVPVTIGGSGGSSDNSGSAEKAAKLSSSLRKAVRSTVIAVIEEEQRPRGILS